MNDNEYQIRLENGKIEIEELDGRGIVLRTAQSVTLFEALGEVDGWLGMESEQEKLNRNSQFEHDMKLVEKLRLDLSSRKLLPSNSVLTLITKTKSLKGEITKTQISGNNGITEQYRCRGSLGLYLVLMDVWIHSLDVETPCILQSHALLKKCENCGKYYSPQQLNTRFCSDCRNGGRRRSTSARDKRVISDLLDRVNHSYSLCRMQGEPERGLKLFKNYWSNYYSRSCKRDGSEFAHDFADFVREHRSIFHSCSEIEEIEKLLKLYETMPQSRKGE